MNVRYIIAAIAFAGPALAAGGPDGATGAPRPAAGPEMRAYLLRDGKEIQAPLFAEEYAALPVAKVDDDAITLRELTNALVNVHQGRAEGAAAQHDFKPVLDRLVDLKLCALEAREMALDDLPEVKKAIQTEEESEIIGDVRARAIKDVKADRAEADRMYRDAVREWNVRSLLFEKEPDAKAFEAALQKRKDFVAVGKEFIAASKAKGTTEAGYSGGAAMLPQVRDAVVKAKKGRVAVVRVAGGWAVVQALGERYPDNLEERTRADARALEGARERAATKFYNGLESRYAKIDRKLLAALDFEAPKPGFAALKKDRRPLARIAGEGPFTVADLAAGLEMKFFHGVESPIKEHRLNPAKFGTLQTLLRRRLVLKEAARLQVASLPAYQRHMAEFRQATLFAAYVERSVMPSVTVTEKEGQDYYAQHKAEFTTPAMYKLESLTFSTAKDAQAALDKVRSGTDFKWLRANAPSQVKEGDRTAQLDNTTVSGNALTSALRAQLAGASVGDYRLGEVDGQYYVIRVLGGTPAREQSYVEARGEIGKKLISQNLQKTLKDSIAKLRQAHPVVVYVTKIGY